MNRLPNETDDEYAARWHAELLEEYRDNPISKPTNPSGADPDEDDQSAVVPSRVPVQGISRGIPYKRRHIKQKKPGLNRIVYVSDVAWQGLRDQAIEYGYVAEDNQNAWGIGSFVEALLDPTKAVTVFEPEPPHITWQDERPDHLSDYDEERRKLGVSAIWWPPRPNGRSERDTGELRPTDDDLRAWLVYRHPTYDPRTKGLKLSDDAIERALDLCDEWRISHDGRAPIGRPIIRLSFFLEALGHGWLVPHGFRKKVYSGYRRRREIAIYPH